MKWYGVIGYNTGTIETEPGVWVQQIEEKSYYGDLVNNRWKHQSSGNVNDNIDLSNNISIVADPYSMNHCSAMVYAELMGTKWKITNVEVQYPRLILTLGGVWNGNTYSTTE